MKINIEINTLEDPAGDVAEKLRQIANMLDGAIEMWVQGTEGVIARVPEESEETLKEIKNAGLRGAAAGKNLRAEMDALKRDKETLEKQPEPATPKPKKQPKKKNKETSALQFQLKNTAHSLSIQDKETFGTWRTDVQARYGTTVIDELPADELPSLIEELESLLDGEK